MCIRDSYWGLKGGIQRNGWSAPFPPGWLQQAVETTLRIAGEDVYKRQLKRPSDFVHKPAITRQQVHLRCLRRLLRCHSYHPVASPSLMRYSVQGPNANCPPNIRSSAGAATETSGAPRVQPEQEDASPIHAGKPPMVPSGKSQKMYSPLGVWPFDAGGGLARAQGATGSES